MFLSEVRPLLQGPLHPRALELTPQLLPCKLRVQVPYQASLYQQPGCLAPQGQPPAAAADAGAKYGRRFTPTPDAADAISRVNALLGKQT
jgi:hypothetical protein